MEGVKDNEEGLEGWTAYQLPHKVSERATDGFELLTHAVDDIIEKLGSKGQRLLKIRSSNITQWRYDNQKWMQARSDDVILVQETHLNRASLASAVAAMRKAGYEMVGGEAANSAKGGTLWGGVAVLTHAHHQARTAQHFCAEGCGFSAVEIRATGVSLLLLSVHLKNSTPLRCPPNAEILSRLMAILKCRTGHWLVAGDFNVEPQEIAATTLVQELGGQLICAGEPVFMVGLSSISSLLITRLEVSSQ